jgi:hypothetical protein
MSNDWNTGNPNYFLGTIDEVIPQPKYDLLIRVEGSTDEDIKLNITETNDFKRHFGNIFNYFNFLKNTLVEVILSQKRSLDYNGFYNAFLMQQLSEEEFINIAKEFTYQPKTCIVTVLLSKINLLFDLTKIDYSSSELADIFQCHGNDIVQAMQLIKDNQFGKRN